MRSGDEPPRQGRVPGDVGICPRRQVRRRAHLIIGLEQLSGLAEVVSGFEGMAVDRGHGRSLGEALLDPVQGALGGPAVEPRDQAQGEEVLRALGITGLDAFFFTHLHGERGHGYLVDGEAVQAPIGQRVGRVARLGQVPLVEGVDVDDQGAPGSHRVHVGLQSGRVHGHQHAGASPGVRMSWSEMWTWKAETPARVPAGALISAGKSGMVAVSLPNSELTVVKLGPRSAACRRRSRRRNGLPRGQALSVRDVSRSTPAPHSAGP